LSAVVAPLVEHTFTPIAHASQAYPFEDLMYPSLHAVTVVESEQVFALFGHEAQAVVEDL